MQLLDQHKVATPANWQRGERRRCSPAGFLWCGPGEDGETIRGCSLLRLAHVLEEMSDVMGKPR